MALVNYDYSDSEEENDEDTDEETRRKSDGNTGKVILNEEIPGSKPELFSCLPTPKSIILDTIEEENDEFLKKTTTDDKKKKRTAVKISVPSINDYNSDEEDVPKKILKPTVESKSTGLFSVLPPPKAVKISSTSFVPHTLTKKPLKPTKTDDQKTSEISNDIEEEPNVPGFNFFSSIFTDKIENLETVKPSSQIEFKIDSARPVQDAILKNNKYFSEMVTNNTAVPEMVLPEPPQEEDLMKEAYSELVGRSRKAKGKKNKKQELDIIDINATDIMPDPRDWMTKTLTEEQPTSAIKKGDEPSLQHRRKHQITYLAYQAKVNEQDLKNQWAMNRMSRKQTQAKYGF